MKKYRRLAVIIAKQIEKGDFSLSGLPSERILAEHLSANRLTIRKALAHLEREKKIIRADNGRYELARQAPGARHETRIALLTPPAFGSGNIRIWYEELSACTAHSGLLFRPFLFIHWNDPSISDVLANYDGVFVIPSYEPAPLETLEQFSRRNGLVFLNTDMSRHRILSLNLYPAILVRQLLDRLAGLGHRSVACLHLQSDISDILNNRISQWAYWSEVNGNPAPLVKADIHPYDESDAFLDAQFKKGTFKGVTAVCCTTVYAAIAMIRACKNRGLDPEKDMAICTVDDEGIGMHATPSIACFHKPELQKFLNPVFAWIKQGGDPNAWKGPLLVEPLDLRISPGETLHPPAKPR